MAFLSTLDPWRTRKDPIFLWNSDRDAFVLWASHGLSARRIGKAEYKRGEGLTGWVGQHGQPLNLSQRSKDTLSAVAPDLEWKAKFREGGSVKALTHKPFMAAPIFGEDRVEGVIRVSDARASEPFSASDLDMLVAVAAHLSAALAVERQRVHRRRALQLISSQVNAVARSLPALMSGASPDNPGLRDTLENVTREVNASAACLYAFDPDRNAFVSPPLHIGANEDRCVHVGVAADDLPSLMLCEESPVFWSVVSRGLHLTKVPPSGASSRWRRFSVPERIKSMAAIPLKVAGVPVGVLVLSYGQRQPFESEQRELIEVLASQLAPLMELSRVYRRLQEHAEREERAYRCFELHDSLQFMTVARQFSQAALGALSAGSAGEASDAVRLAERALTTAHKEISGVLASLDTPGPSPSMLAALKRIHEDVWRSAGLTLELPRTEVSLPYLIEHHFYRIAETAIANAIGPGSAGRVKVSVERTRTRARLRIEDDGKGFKPAVARRLKNHYGLRSILWRAKRLAGFARIKSKPGHGTVISVSVPLEGTPNGSNSIGEANSSSIAARLHG